jgi:hypothetical protein
MRSIIENYSIDVEEYNKCKNDISYFAEKYISYVDPNVGYVSPIKLHAYQYEALQHNKLIADTARQIGFSTLAKIRVIHSLIFNQDKTIAVVSGSLTQSRHEMQEIRRMFEECTYKYKPKIITSNKTELRTDTYMRVFATNLSSNYFRGLVVSEMYVSEISFVSRREIDDFFWGSFPVINSPKNVVVWFYGVETSRATGLPDGYHYMNLPYYVIPNRGREWVERTKRIMSREQFDKEFLSKF